MKRSFNNKSIRTGTDILSTEIPNDSPLRDAVYLLGKVTLSRDKPPVICIDIPGDFPAIIANQGLRDSLAVDLPTLKEIEARSLVQRQESILLSAGSFIWFGDCLGLLRRDNKTPYKPLHLNQPIGRMDDRPSRVAMRELNEEIHLFVQEQGLLYPVILSFNKLTGIAVEDKLEKLQKLQGFYNGKLNIQERVVFSEVERNEKDSPYFSEIAFSVDGTEIERQKMIVVFSEEMHTFELNFSLKAGPDLETGRMLALSGEPMGRDALFLREEGLNGEKLSASLAAYNQMRKTDHNPQIESYRQFLTRCP